MSNINKKEYHLILSQNFETRTKNFSRNFGNKSQMQTEKRIIKNILLERKLSFHENDEENTNKIISNKLHANQNINQQGKTLDLLTDDCY